MYLTNKHRRIIADKLTAYLHVYGDFVTPKTVQRTRQWAIEDRTLDEIAESEGVSHQAISQSIHSLAPKVLEWNHED